MYSLGVEPCMHIYSDLLLPPCGNVQHILQQIEHNVENKF